MQAKEIVDAMMEKHLANHELVTQFGLPLDKADKIGRLSAHAFGPGGKGYDWYVKQVEKILQRKAPFIMESSDREQIDAKIARIARMLISSPETHKFTKMVPIKFKPEGSTMNSLANARAIQEAGYEFQSGTTYYDNVKGNYDTVVWFTRGSETAKWIFKGFSAGYNGEGPRGLVEFGTIFGIPIKDEVVRDREYLTSRNFLDGTGVNLGEYY